MSLFVSQCWCVSEGSPQTSKLLPLVLCVKQRDRQTEKGNERGCVRGERQRL